MVTTEMGKNGHIPSPNEMLKRLFGCVLLHEKRGYFRNLLIFNALQDGLEPTTP